MVAEMGFKEMARGVVIRWVRIATMSGDRVCRFRILMKKVVSAVNRAFLENVDVAKVVKVKKRHCWTW